MKKRLVSLLVLFLVASACFSYSIEGKYDILVKTPVGLEKGTVTVLKTAGKDTYEGIFNLFKHDNAFEGATWDGKVFSFSGKMKYTILKIKFTCQGYISETGIITAEADTAMGKMPVSGNRAQE